MALPVILILLGLLFAALVLGMATLQLNEFDKKTREFCAELLRRYPTKSGKKNT